MIGNDSLWCKYYPLLSEHALLYALQDKSAWKFGYGDVLKCIHNVYGYASRMLGVNLEELKKAMKQI